MFTGIITDIGTITAVNATKGGTQFTIKTVYDTDTIDLGASVASDGVCLTVTDKANAPNGNWYTVDVSGETLRCTTLGSWGVGHRVNLERAMKLGDEVGGHLVLGHVDTVIPVVSVESAGDSVCITFDAGDEYSRYVVAKGSVVINGVSLTVNQVTGSQFAVNIIPHTQEKTTLGNLSAGDGVNLEIDMMARYVERLVAPTAHK